MYYARVDGGECERRGVREAPRSGKGKGERHLTLVVGYFFLAFVDKHTNTHTKREREYYLYKQ